MRSGIIAAEIANQWRGKKDTKARPIDFMPYVEQVAAEPQTEAQMMAALNMVEKIANGND